MASNRNSVQTILTANKDEDNLSDWSLVWSTTQVPGMDRGTGAGHSRRAGRRRLRLAALSQGVLLCMHCRVVASALTTGVFLFILLLVLATIILGNSIRHFEVYLGQWSISGPGRAFRILPSIDGLGMAICIHAIFRSITCVGIAAVAGVYILSTIHDDKLPVYYCRNFSLQYYSPKVAYVNVNLSKQSSLEDLSENDMFPVALEDPQWKETEQRRSEQILIRNYNATMSLENTVLLRRVLICNETYPGTYPPLYKTAAYNYFYIEAMHYRPNMGIKGINTKHLAVMMVLYAVIWFLMVLERINYGRLIWNNMYVWFGFIPPVWACVLLSAGIYSLVTSERALQNIFTIGGSNEVVKTIIDAFEVSMYIHASALGSEIIHGKGLNHYVLLNIARGHIDPYLNSEVLWHSALVVMVSSAAAVGGAVCAMTDYMQTQGINRAHESALWVLPMYAKCAAGVTGYTHTVSILIFSGIIFAYTTVAFVCLKTALHTIFEYRVRLVFVEQFIVGALIICCAAISVLFSTYGGLALVEGFDGILAGIAAPLICAVEFTALMYVYQSRDFVSDMNVATEDNACATRIGTQWQIAPFLCFGVFIVKFVCLIRSELPASFQWSGLSIVLLMVIVVPLRAFYNAYLFLHPPTKI